MSQDSHGNSRGLTIALSAAPFVATALVWLIDVSASERWGIAKVSVILLVPVALAATTSVLVGVDAWRAGRSPAWALGTFVLWPVFSTIYLAVRCRTARARVGFALLGAFAAIVFDASAVGAWFDLDGRGAHWEYERSGPQPHEHTGEFPPF